ncbi:MAG TPA: sigma-70 family RNA polymerase sigma factor [Ilumatobacteraceae bacterium]|nr:sigma-70 family RNA polymerase sigma factor [Ilumatobacteraceae bacterium]
MDPADDALRTAPQAPPTGLSGQLSAAELNAEFEQFFLAQYASILRALDSATGHHDVAVDATQDAFIKAHTRWALIRTYEAPDTWVRRVAINVSRDRMRSERRRRNREATHDASAQPSTTEQFEADANVRALLDQLPQRQREVARLFYVEDRSVDDIARQLDVSSGTVKSYLAQARDRLRQVRRS